MALFYPSYIANNVPFSNNLEVHNLTKDDFFTETTIQRFGYALHNEEWVKKGTLQTKGPSDAQDDDERAQMNTRLPILHA